MRPLALFHRVSRTVSSGAGLDFILDELVRLTSEATDCDACLVYLLEPESGDFLLRAWQLPEPVAVGGLRRKAGFRPDAVAAVSQAAWTDPRFEWFGSFLPETCEAALSAPLIAGGAPAGILSVHHKAPRAHTPEEIALVTFVGEQMGCAVQSCRLANENSRLRDETQKLKGQLEARKLVERAKGILQQQLGITEEQAYLRLRNESRRMRRPMVELARVILLEENSSRGRQASRAAG